jgi:hypothetical protein
MPGFSVLSLHNPFLYFGRKNRYEWPEREKEAFGKLPRASERLKI